MDGKGGLTNILKAVDWPISAVAEDTLERLKFQTPFAVVSDDDHRTVGKWTRSAGVCMVAGRRKGFLSPNQNETFLADMGGENSFESLDIRAQEVLDKSIQALESSHGLASCAFSMTTGALPWDEGRQGDEENDHLNVRDRVWDLPERNPGGPAMGHLGYDHALDKVRVLKEIVNTSDYASKMSAAAKILGMTGDRMPLPDPKIKNVRENASKNVRAKIVEYEVEKSCNELSKRSLVDVALPAHPSPPSSASLRFDNRSPRNCCQVPENVNSSHDITKDRVVGGEVCFEARSHAKSCEVATRDTPAQTELTGLPGYRTSTFEGKRPPSSSRPPTRPRLDWERKSSLVASQRRRISSRESWHSAKVSTRPQHTKLMLPSKLPRWRGLSAALSPMRLICHGADLEASIIDAKAKPLLIIAGKCVFRTSAPLDTPRVRTTGTPMAGLTPRAENGKASPPPTRSGAAANADAIKAMSMSRAVQQQLPSPIVSGKASGPLPGPKGKAGSRPTRHWPPVLHELDNWISQTVHEWLDKGDHLSTTASPHSSVTDCKPVPSYALDVSREKAVAGPLALAISGHLLQECDPRKFPGSAPNKKLSNLDNMIGQAQTVHDLCQILEPVGQATLLPSSREELEMEEMKLSPGSVLKTLGKDEVVQDFHRKILALEQDIEGLRSSLPTREEHSGLCQRLQALGF